MFHLPSCSKPLQKLSQLNRLERCVPESLHFSRLPHTPRAIKTPLPSPWYICKMSLVSARSRRSYRKIEDYEQFIEASCGSLSWPWCLTSTQFPLPLPTPHPGPCVIELSLVKTCEGGHNTAEKILGEVSLSVDEFSPWKRRKHAKNEETNISHYHGQYFAGKKVFNTSRGCFYSVWKYLPSLSSLHELVSKRPKNVKLC